MYGFHCMDDIQSSYIVWMAALMQIVGDEDLIHCF